ncbi:MAG: DUF2169 domain-containing protein [Myxococcota bacterium]
MKVIKPHRLGILTRTMTADGRRYGLAIGALVSVPLDQPKALGMEVALWKDVAEQVPGGVLDEGNAKPQGEVVVCGHAVAPGGNPAPAVMTRLRVERDGKALVDKRIAVQGDRYWKGSKPTEAVPFTELPVHWPHAFGGEGFAPNPAGKGAATLDTEHGPLQPLPNVENPRHLVVSPRDRPDPVSYGVLPLEGPQRMQYAGKTYDAHWLEHRFPGPAVDFDPKFHLVTQPDQHITNFFTGTETITVEGMHRDGTVSGTLTPLVVKALLTRRDDNAADAVAGDDEASDAHAVPERFTEHRLKLETLVVLPNIGRLICIYRGVVPCRDDDADDVVHLLLAAEDPARPKAIDHYRDVLHRRLDKEKGALWSLKDEDLMPPAADGWLAKPDYGDMVDKTRLEHRGLKRAEAARKRKLEATKKELLAAGFDVEADFAEPETPEIPDPYDVDAILEVSADLEQRAEAMKSQADADKARMEREARESFAKMGLDWDAEQEKAMVTAGGPPDFSADDQLVMLHDMARIAADGGAPLEDLERDLTDPAYETMLRELEARVRDSYVSFAHLMPAAAAPDDAARQRLRVIVTAAHDSRSSLAGRNLCGADLSGMRLSGIDLSGAFLEGADLSGADLSGANLQGAVLARARLTDTNLSRADLTGANLGATHLERTDLSEANLKDTVIMRAELDGVILHGARLEGVDFLEVTFTDADFSHVHAHQALFLQSDLRRVRFTGASLIEARFLQLDLRGVDFTGAQLDRAQFIQCQADDASFAGADLTGAGFVHETTCRRAVFAGATLDKINLHRCPAAGADLSGARLQGANLIKADLRGANLQRTVGREALLMRADLRGANLRGADLLGAIAQKVDVRGANLSGSNLSRGDISLARMDDTTDVGDALLIDTRVDPKRRDEGQERGK